MIERQHGVVVNGRAGKIFSTSAIADLQRAGVDDRNAGAGVRSRQDQRAGAHLDQCAHAADDRRERRGTALIDGKCAVVGDAAGTIESCRAGAIAELQGAGGDSGGAAIRIASRKNQRAGVGQGQGADSRLRDVAGNGERCSHGRQYAQTAGKHDGSGNDMAAVGDRNRTANVSVVESQTPAATGTDRVARRRAGRISQQQTADGLRAVKRDRDGRIGRNIDLRALSFVRWERYWRSNLRV